MIAAICIKRTLFNQPQISFIHKGSTLQSVSWALSPEMVPRNFAQFLVDQRN